MTYVKTILKVLTVGLLAMLLMSCDAHKLMSMAIKKDPSILDSTTVVSRDTTLLETVRVDTVFRLKRDTLIRYVQKDNLGKEIEVQVRWRTKTDTLEIQVDCPDQETIIETKETTVTVKVVPKWFKWVMRGGIFGLILIAALAIKSIFKRL